MQTKVSLTYRGDMHCETIGADGRTAVPIDSAASKGNPGSGFSPLDLLALAHGACTAMMLAKAAAPLGLDVQGLQTEVQHDYEMGPPMRLKQARIRFLLPIPITPDEENALRAGAALCPVHTALRPEVSVKLELISAQ